MTYTMMKGTNTSTCGGRMYDRPTVGRHSSSVASVSVTETASARGKERKINFDSSTGGENLEELEAEKDERADLRFDKDCSLSATEGNENRRRRGLLASREIGCRGW